MPMALMSHFGAILLCVNIFVRLMPWKVPINLLV